MGNGAAARLDFDALMMRDREIREQDETGGRTTVLPVPKVATPPKPTHTYQAPTSDWSD